MEIGDDQVPFVVEPIEDPVAAIPAGAREPVQDEEQAELVPA
jgi:hypothetical protein